MSGVASQARPGATQPHPGATELVDAPPPAGQSQPAEACPLCRAPLAREQEWCLRCGAAARTRLAATPNWHVPVATVAILAALALGVLAAALVKLANDSGPAPAPATTTVTAAASTAGVTTTPTTFTTPASTVPGTRLRTTGTVPSTPASGAAGSTTGAPGGGTPVPSEAAAGAGAGG